MQDETAPAFEIPRSAITRRHMVSLPRTATKSLPASLETPIVFVVDGDISVRKSLELQVAKAGWLMETFESAQEFLSRPRAVVPSCLVLDVTTPGLDGLDLQKRFAAERPEMPVIVLSRHRDVSMAVQAMKAGAVEFLPKPFNNDVLLSAIHDAIERSVSAHRLDVEMQSLRASHASLSRREEEVMTCQAQRRERDARLVTGDVVAATIAHEVKQPLAAMITRSDTGFRWLDRAVPDLEKAKAEFRHIAADGQRAAAIIEGIRANFRNDAWIKTSLDVNDLIQESVELAREDLDRHRVLIKAVSHPQKPRVVGDRIQLQQVLLNLITNAIDAMAAKEGLRVLCVKSDLRHDGTVEVSVEDTGTGISPQDVDRVFSPLFTTKSGGMGMGLSICRSIVEAHEGQLWVIPNVPEGAVFRFALRADGSGNPSDPEEV